jgi:integrase/recombinase XerD
LSGKHNIINELAAKERMMRAARALGRKAAGLPPLKPEEIAPSEPLASRVEPFEAFDDVADAYDDDSPADIAPDDGPQEEPLEDVAPESEGVAGEGVAFADGKGLPDDCPPDGETTEASAPPTSSVAMVVGVSPAVALVMPPALAPHIAIGRRAGREDLIRSFMLSKGPAASKRTTRQGLDRIARLWGASAAEGVPWCDLRFEHTNAIRAELINRAYKKHTIRSTLTALRGILIHACDLELIDAEYLRRVTRWQPVRGKDLPPGRLVEKEEIEKLRAYCASQDGLYGRFLDAMFALLLGVGLRADEACRMPISAYDQAAEFVRVRRKRDKETELPVDEYVKAALDAWLVDRLALPRRRINTDAFLVRVQENDWVRPQTAQMDVKMLEYLLETVARKAGIGRLTPHDLRRTFCTTLLDEGTDVFVTAGLMSHDDPKTTMAYDRRPAQRRAEARRKVRIW